MISPYLAQQLSGPISQAVIDTTKAEFDKTQVELDYMTNADIDLDSGDFLYLLGLWAGMPWPLAPDGTFSDSMFEFGDVADYPLTSINGFNSGLFSSVNVSSLVLYPAPVYRLLLKAYCKIKTLGSSLRNIEELVTALCPTYTISFTADRDLLFTFSPNITGSYLYALRWIAPIVSVSPQILFAQG